MTRADDAVATRLDADRKALLDLTLRNPLLNYRPRARGLEFVGEPPVEVYRLLVTEGRALSFLHDPDAREVAPNPEAPSPATGDDSGAVGSTTTDTPLVEEPSADKPPASEPVDTPVEPATEAADSVRGRAATSRRMPQANPTDHKLQTTLSAEQLEARLLSIYYAARTSIEERGVNTLFLVLGMLNWSDGGSPERLVRAPLILIPVELQRSSARERYRIRLEGEDVGFNLSLAEKLRTGFRLTLPALPDADELDVAGYFRAVAEAVSSQKSWSVDREAVALGFFSFGKFLMYLDLDTEVWPPTEAPAVHPLLAALLGEGFREPAARVGDDEPVDPHIDPRTARQVVDADSSQSLALLDVKHGRNLVIQGPPGTGKSQTITNLIAEAVAQGKTVLFVAEKLAALEVVKRRLDQAGVGDVCLELHSHKTQKKAVLAELRRTLQLVKPRLGAVDDDVTRLIAVRDRLNAYAEALNAPIGASGTTPFDAIGNVVEARGARESEPLPRPALPEVDSWSRADFLSRLALAEQLQARVLETGPPRRNPFWGSRCTLLLPADLDRLRSAIPEARMATQALDRAGSQLATLLGLDAPRSPRMVDQLVHAADWLVTRPALPGCQIRAAEWRARRPEIQAILAAIEAFRAVTGKPENRSVWVMAWEYGHDPSRLRALWDGAQESIRRGQSPDATGLWPSKRSYGEDLSGLRALRADLDRYGRPGGTRSRRPSAHPRPSGCTLPASGSPGSTHSSPSSTT
ncbi:MAG: DUF4011 domain-containing protein [Isosphaeraceae bacterium]